MRQTPKSPGEKIDLVAVTAITDYADLAANHMENVGLDVVITAEVNPGADNFVFVCGAE